MKKLFNEIGISLVLGDGNWIGASHEIEVGEDETRSWGLSFPQKRVFEGCYLRFWIGKSVFVYKKGGWKISRKGKYGFKCIFGMQYSL